MQKECSCMSQFYLSGQFMMVLTYCILLPCWVFVQGCQMLRKHCALVWLAFIPLKMRLNLFILFTYSSLSGAFTASPKTISSVAWAFWLLWGVESWWQFCVLSCKLFANSLQALCKFFGVLLTIAVSHPWKVTKLQCNSSSVVISTPFNVCRRLHKRKTEKAL